MELDIDLVHTNDRIRSNAFAVYGARLAGRSVVTHERWLSSYSWSDRLASRFVTVLCCVSKAVHEKAVTGGVAPKANLVVYDSVEIPPARPSEVLSPRVTFVGRLVRWKGVEFFVEACGLLADSYPDLRFTVAGGDTASGGPFLKRLKLKATKLGLDGRIEFTGTIRDVAQLLSESSILVRASIELISATDLSRGGIDFEDRVTVSVARLYVVVYGID